MAHNAPRLAQKLTSDQRGEPAVSEALLRAVPADPTEVVVVRPELLICAGGSEIREELSDSSIEVRGIGVSKSFNELEIDLFSVSEL